VAAWTGSGSPSAPAFLGARPAPGRENRTGSGRWGSDSLAAEPATVLDFPDTVADVNRLALDVV
jgi:hypothetical protein